ncbi:Kinase-like protein [Mycena kentingensis (nom. inval.)]|nr:Kinase-like protein [Mycena kentingensis (nom. inval.)]
MSTPTVILEDTSIGSGRTARVYRGTVQSTNKLIAVKQSRVSLRVPRPYLQHEVRILHLLQGDRAIPELFGYYRGPHFEYIGMELLGPSLQGLLWNRRAEGGGRALRAESVASIAMQMLSALIHLFDKGVVHRDIKPNNILLCLTDPSAVRLVDFGLSSLFDAVCPRDPCPALTGIIGTLAYCSIHVHDHRWPLQPSDDLESLVYTLLFLLGGSLPWDDGGISAFSPKSVAHVANTKRALVASRLADCDPLAAKLGQLLEYARGLEDHAASAPCYDEWIHRLENYTSPAAPLDTSLVPPAPALANLLAPLKSPEIDDRVRYTSAGAAKVPRYDDSNSDLQQDEWTPGRDRPTDLTFPDPRDADIPSFYTELPAEFVVQ